MNKTLANLAIKAGKTIIMLISQQIIKYVSSEEFSKQVKKFIEAMVKQVVQIVISEKQVVVKK